MLLIQPGQIINDTYRIDRLLGSGGMADVYVVTHCRMPRQFALKVMRVDSDASAPFLERFKREAEILARLRHSHIVDVIDHDIMADGRPYMVMDLLEGEDLNTFLAKNGELPLPLALHLCHQIGEALSAAHSVGITHRDLKPSNIFLCQREAFPNFVKILDFGIAKLSVPSESTVTKTNTAVIGTPGYMAPEQVFGKTEKLGPAADQFALAAILYEMLSGRPAFYGAHDSVYAIMARTVNDPPPDLVCGLPPLRAAVKRAFSKEPADRFPSMDSFLAAIGATSLTVFQEIPPPKVNPPSTLGVREGEVLTQLSRQRMFRSAGLGALCAFVATMGAFFAWRRAKPELPRIEMRINAAQPKSADPPSAEPVLIRLAENQPSETAPAQTPAVRPDPSSHDEKSEKKEPVRGNKIVRRPSSPLPRTYVISGVKNPVDVQMIKTCLQTTLNGVAGLEGSVIRLERSGSLQIVDALPSVHRTSLDACLQQAFIGTEVKQLPQSAVIRVVRGG